MPFEPAPPEIPIDPDLEFNSFRNSPRGVERFEMSRITNDIDRRLAFADKYGLPQELSPGVSGAIMHTAQGLGMHTRIILDENVNVIQNGDAAALGGGVELFAVPGVKMRVVASRISYALTLSAANMSTTAGEIGLGTTVASGAVAVLGGTAAFENILEGGANGRGGAALGNIAAGATIRGTVFDQPVLPAPASGVASSVFLNGATTFANADPSNLVALAGTEIDVWWFPMDG